MFEKQMKTQQIKCQIFDNKITNRQFQIIKYPITINNQKYLNEFNQIDVFDINQIRSKIKYNQNSYRQKNMGNQTSQNSLQQLKQLKNYQEVSHTPDGVIYRQRITDSQQQSYQYFILKQHNYHNQESYEQAYKKYKQALNLYKQSTKYNTSQQQTDTCPQSNTLAIKQVVKQQVQHFCSNTYKIFTLYQFPQLTLKDQIQVRAKQNKFFQECQIVAILQTCVLALQQIKAIISFNPKYIFISPDGVIKVIHSDLVDENYRHVVTPRTYYAPQKLTNFMSESTSEISLKKQIIFSMGMTILEACLLQQIYDIYNYQRQLINQQKLINKIQTLTHKYNNQLIQLISNMLQINPNRRISLLQVQRTLNKFDQLNNSYLNTHQNQKLNQQNEELQKEEIQTEDLQNKCDKFFVHDGHTLPRIKQSNQSNQQPSIPNLISHQNSSRISLTKNCQSQQSYSLQQNYNSNKSYNSKSYYNSKGNTSDQFYYKIQNSIEGYKLTCNLPILSNKQPQFISLNHMTAHFTQNPQPKPSNDHLFTDPKLLQMIRKDLQQINKSRTSRILNNEQINNSWVNTSQNVIQNSVTNRYKPHQNFKPNSSFLNQSSYDQFSNKKQFVEYTTLNNCPQVQSLAASIAVDSSNQKNSYFYQQSQVKRHPQDRLNTQTDPKMKVSIALSTKNFDSNNQPNNQQQTKQKNDPSTVRYPLRQVNTNLNPASSLSEVESQIKAAMMKKKQSNLVYLQQVYEDGVKYEGMSKNGLKQGYGKLIYSDGAYYEGYFHNDKINGKGILYYKKNHPAYDGQWLDQQFNGYGQLYNQQPQELDQQFPFHNWNFLENYWIKYEGEFMNDNKHGHGKIILTTDEYIEGEFYDDMLNGWGKFYKQNGDYIEGRWQNNILVQLKNQ